MDVDAGDGVGHFAQDARDDRHFEQVQLVRDAVVDHGQDGRVAKNGFARAGRSRVALIGGPCVRGEQTPDVRKPLDELKRLFPRDTLALKALLRVFRARKARAAADLLRQLAENGIEVGGKMVAHGLHTHVGHAEVTRLSSGATGFLPARPAKAWAHRGAGGGRPPPATSGRTTARSRGQAQAWQKVTGISGSSDILSES